MSRNRDRKPDNIYLPYWASADRECSEISYVRKGKTFMMDARVKALSSSAYRVYDYMLLNCQGREEFDMSYAPFKKTATMSKAVMSRPTYYSALKELEEAGFIKVTHPSYHPGTPSKIKFSRSWRATNTSEVK